MKYKNIFNLLFSSIFCMIILLGIQSCGGMDELSNRFLDDGSVVYAAKIDSVMVRPGDRKVEFEIFVKTQRIDFVRIFWNDGKDYKDVEVKNQPGIYKELLDLEVGAYVFNLVSFDKYGNQSLKVEAEANVYDGEDFVKNKVKERRMHQVAFNSKSGELEIDWGPLVNFGIENEVKYINVEGKEVTLEVPFSESETIITDWGFSDITYRTLSKPNEVALDTYYSDYTSQSRVYVSKKGWSILGYSSQVSPGDNAVSNAINGIYTDRWHTGSGYPHWISIDLGGEVEFKGFSITPSVFDLGPTQIVDIRFPKLVRFEVSKDNETWISLGEFPATNTSPETQLFMIETPATGRYYRFTGIQGPDNDGSGFLVLGELDVICK